MSIEVWVCAGSGTELWSGCPVGYVLLCLPIDSFYNSFRVSNLSYYSPIISEYLNPVALLIGRLKVKMVPITRERGLMLSVVVVVDYRYYSLVLLPCSRSYVIFVYEVCFIVVRREGTVTQHLN